MTQAVLRSIKGEEVNNVSDNAESLAVADIIKECYYEIVSNQDFPELNTLFELTASGDNTKPTLMTIPSDVIGVKWLKYDKQQDGDTAANFDFVNYVPLREFLDMNHSLSTDEDNVGSFEVSTGSFDSPVFYYRNDKAPDWYTSFNDTTLIFDSYDVDVDDTLVKAKTMAYGLKESSWSNTNTFTPDLDSQQFMILLKEAKAMAWLELRQTENAYEAKKVRKAKIMFEKNRSKADHPNTHYYHTLYRGYGRK
jgi:hypothetical protein